MTATRRIARRWEATSGQASGGVKATAAGANADDARSTNCMAATKKLAGLQPKKLRWEATIGRAAGGVKTTDVGAVAARSTNCTDVIKRSAPRWEVTIGLRLGAARI